MFIRQLGSPDHGSGALVVEAFATAEVGEKGPGVVPEGHLGNPSRDALWHLLPLRKLGNRGNWRRRK